MTDKTGRATTIAELETILQNYFGHSEPPDFVPHPTDIIISPHAKSGTTWLQQITHGLRTRGSMDFTNINAAVPWIGIAADMGWDLEADQIAHPRLFKSHRTWHDIWKGGRYICAIRHPYDCLISIYRFFEGWFFEPQTIDIETFARWAWLREENNQKGYWPHLISWWKQHNNPDVLLLCYEEMKADLPATVEKVAHFMGIPLDDELREIVIRQSSREFMLAHRQKFDEHDVHATFGPQAGLPTPLDSSKVTAGTPNEARYQLSPTLKQELDQVWQKQIQRTLGFKNYDELRHALKTLT